MTTLLDKAYKAAYEKGLALGRYEVSLGHDSIHGIVRTLSNATKRLAEYAKCSEEDARGILELSGKEEKKKEEREVAL